MRLDFPNIEGDIDIYMKVMRAICGDTEGKSMIDLMCAFAPNTPKLGFWSKRYVDVIDRKLDHPGEQPYFYNEDVFEPLKGCCYMSEQFDVSICSDGIEHVTLEQGAELLRLMEILSYRQVIFTPLGEIFKLATDDNQDPEAHRSLWTPEMFQARGYAVIVYPDYHKIWNGGGIFAWHCVDIQKDFERVKSILL